MSEGERNQVDTSTSGSRTPIDTTSSSDSVRRRAKPYQRLRSSLSGDRDTAAIEVIGRT